MHGKLITITTKFTSIFIYPPIYHKIFSEIYKRRDVKDYYHKYLDRIDRYLRQFQNCTKSSKAHNNYKIIIIQLY